MRVARVKPGCRVFTEADSDCSFKGGVGFNYHHPEPPRPPSSSGGSLLCNPREAVLAAVATAAAGVAACGDDL